VYRFEALRPVLVLKVTITTPTEAVSDAPFRRAESAGLSLAAEAVTLTAQMKIAVIAVRLRI
jgi:hypothetical protein